MKKTFLFLFLLSSFFGHAQYTAIPDVNFEQALINLGIDSGSIDGKVLTASVANLKSLGIPNKNISDLTGIEAFVQLEKLDIGNTTLNYPNKISSLNLSKNINLTFLNCQKNDLSSLDTSANTALISLNCNHNQLTNLDVSKNTVLTNFDCGYNLLTNLDVSTNINLLDLNCQNNLLTSLDVSKNTILTTLNFIDNQFPSIDVSKNLLLQNLICYNNKLTYLDISKNINLLLLNCLDNLLTSLDVSKNTALTSLVCADNQIPSIDVSKNLLLKYLACDQNKLTNLDISINIALTYLGCSINQLTNLDISKNLLLKNLFCNYNKLTNLDISKNTHLIYIECDNNQLTNLDVSRNTALLYFRCHNNQLLDLNLKNGNNKLISPIFLNLGSNPSLKCIQVDDATYSNTNWFLKKDAIASFSEDCNTNSINAPAIKAEGDQAYCPRTYLKIAKNVSITHDPSETGSDAVYIQISSGYVSGQDFLALSYSFASTNPSIVGNFNATEGKLKLYSPTGNTISYADFETAIEEVEFFNWSSLSSGSRTFSISTGDIGQLSYLPRNGHYYQYVPDSGISWTSAKNNAAAKNYYGLQGYLATLTAEDEAQLAGKQASGTGWIGGSDAETEGVWKWVTGPEAGTIFWNGKNNGSTTAPFYYANWNSPKEPNDSGNNEDYAHITSPAVGNLGTWNDLPEKGDPPGNYFPRGYIVEYGGMPNDPVLELSASTTITIASISSTTPASRCDAGTVTLQAVATGGTINWYDALTGGNYMGSGTSFTTNITTNTSFYVETATATCASDRIAVDAKIINTPNITSTNSPATNCGSGAFTLRATPSEGTINWYSQNNGPIVGSGLSYTTPIIAANTTYYAEAINKGCPNSTKTPVDLIVYQLPQLSDQPLTKCVAQKITLNADLPNMTYLWSTGAITQTIDVIDKGTYTVAVTSLAPENCTNKKTITVSENNKPEIKNIKVDETTITIELVKTEDYFEFSIDGINYQSSNVFANAPSGLHTAYVREINFCSIDQKEFVVIVVPKFFTPNNDGYNDVWDVKGLINYPLGEITIFDRYGKLITQLNYSNRTWDGTFNKNPLPATDYWYILKLDKESPEVKGHFSLKR